MGPVQEVGWHPIALTEQGRLDPLLMGLPDQFNAFHWHGDTFTLPAYAQRLAESASYPNQVFRVGSNAYGFQCHLEITEEMIREWMSVYAGELTPRGGPIAPETNHERPGGKHIFRQLIHKLYVLAVLLFLLQIVQ